VFPLIAKRHFEIISDHTNVVFFRNEAEEIASIYLGSNNVPYYGTLIFINVRNEYSLYCLLLIQGMFDNGYIFTDIFIYETHLSSDR
jgi:hypothetical protein